MTLKIAIAQMDCIVGDLDGNSAKIFDAAKWAHEQGADILLTPELSLAGYSPEDLLHRGAFCDANRRVLNKLVQSLAVFPDLHVIVGHPFLRGTKLFNAASIIVNGRIFGMYFKHELPNYSVFDEKRYFSSGENTLIFEVKGVKLAINICDDCWFPEPPKRAKKGDAQIMLSINSSPYHTNKQGEREKMMRENVISQGLALVYANLVGGQDELIFDGNSFVMNQQGEICMKMKHCEEDRQIITFDGTVPRKSELPLNQQPEAQIYDALTLGLRDYVRKNGFPSVVLGLSGGIDSALVLALAVDALGSDSVHAVMMPSPYTSQASLEDAREMAKRLRVKYSELPIEPCVNIFENTLAEEFAGKERDITEENIQARVRGTMLMALSNKNKSIVLNTGNKSEMTVGYCTLYGDMAGGIAVIKDIAKTMVYRLAYFRNTRSEIIPPRILTRPPSAELRPNQTDQDTLPPYEVLDAIMQKYMEENQSIYEIVADGFSESDVRSVVNMIHASEHKRRQAPPGLRITHRGFGRDWRYPITSKFKE